MKSRKPVIIVVLLAAAAAGYYLYQYWNRQGTDISTSGHVEVTEADISFRVPGHVARLLVNEGDQVKKDMMLAELKPEILQARRDQAEAQVKELEARQASLELAIKIKEDVLAAEIKRAEAGVSAAEARYQSLKSGSRKEEIGEAAATLERARTEMENRQRDHQRLKNLFERGIVSASQYEDARTGAEAARAAYAATYERYRLIKTGPREETVREGEANLTGSDAALSAATAGLREVEKLKLDLKALRAQGEQARAVLAAAEEDLAQSRIYAPFDGFVTVKNVEPGEFVQAGTPVVTLAQLDQVWVKTYVPETQLGRIRLGQKAEVVSDTFNKTYPGTVTYVSPKAEFTPKNVQTKEERVKLVYRLKVSLANPNQELKAGMPVDVSLR
ncbi:MAG: efflux RND transporter periplasmic adaptor subunit [Thermodesulfobacteriota bacterium]